MKDIMEVVTAKVRAMRISKTSASTWTLYGPVDQALKTSIQTKAVRVISMYPTVHDEIVPCELWISAAPFDPNGDVPPNPHAMVIVQMQRMRTQGENIETTVTEIGETTVEVTSISAQGLITIGGPAILTGPGGTDLPDKVAPTCLLAALLGAHQ